MCESRPSRNDLAPMCPSTTPSWDLLTNDQIAAARMSIDKFLGSRRLLGHAVFRPKKKGWMEDVDRAIATLKPDRLQQRRRSAWKRCRPSRCPVL